MESTNDILQTHGTENQGTTKTLSQQGTKIISVDEFESLKKELEILEQKSQRIEVDFDRLEKRTDSYSNKITNMSMGILLATAILTIIISIDYFYSSGQRYEGFIDKVQEIGDRSYTKEESEQPLIKFKDCLRAGGWNGCLSQ